MQSDDHERTSMSEVARQETHIVKVAPVPSMLSDLGVRIGRDEDSNLAVVLIPPDVRKALNVINPVSSFAQADPNWTPSISIVQLDKELHSYSVTGKLALNKQALETLGKAAGVLYTRAVPVPRAELREGERWAFRATVGFRRSDGTIDEVTRERGFNEEAEKAEIEQAVRSAKVYQSETLKFDTEEKVAAECYKRWLNELRFGPAKTESKAINRALRAGLQVPTSLPPAAFGKPFLVIGYSFTPDYNDVEVKRILIAAGLNAQAAIYGGRDVSGEIGPATDIEASPVAEREGEDADTDVVEAASAALEGSDAAASDDQQADSAAEVETGKAAESVPGDDDPEPLPDEPEQPAAEQSAFPVPDDIMEKVEATTVDMPSSAWTGRTLAEIGAAGEKGEKWLGWALRQPDEKLPGDLRAQVHAYVKARKPDLWAAYAGDES